MELVMLLSMLLFMGFCTIILILAVSNIQGKSEGEQTISATTTSTRPDRDSRV